MSRSDPPLGLINAPWWEVIGAPLLAEELDREQWIREVKDRLGLVCIGDNTERVSLL
jgi:hypothetical protein